MLYHSVGAIQRQFSCTVRKLQPHRSLSIIPSSGAPRRATLSTDIPPRVLTASPAWGVHCRSNYRPHFQALSYGLREYSVCDPFTDYEQEKKTFQLDVPEYFNFAKDVIDKWADAEQTGERDATVPGFWWVHEDGREVKWTYQELASKSNRTANILKDSCGLQPGDRAIIMLPKVPQWWLFNIGAIRSGVVLSPGTMMLRSSDLSHRLQSSQATCIITNGATADIVDQVADQCPNLRVKLLVDSKSSRNGWFNFDELFESASEQFECVNTKGSDPMTLFFTSGTTGSPKMAEHTHASYGLGHTITARYFLRLTKTSVFWNMSDTGWAKSAWSSVFSPWISGSCVFVYNNPRFDPLETIKVLADFPITHFCSSATAFRSIIKHDLTQHHFPHLHHCVSAGEPVNPEVIEEWKNGTGLTLYEGYGQSETTFLCGSYPCIEVKPGSMGKASPGIDVQVVDDSGVILPRGKEGNIGVRYKPHRPVGLFSRYVGDPEKTASVFCGDFYLTGDRAYMDEDDYIFFVGRADDVILSSGYRIGPFEVESALLEHPAVLESAVVSSPDDARGEIVKAFVVLTSKYKGVDTDMEKLGRELQDHVKQSTAPYKYPRKIEFVEELPKTVSGKIRRVELRNKEWGR
ncbi:acyl-coenzyme A synthetase ACSM3, mitochondrial-like [Haliotis rubra]|uniref:acyl-coenzyme A synthetase ACSM3, mitochondrial-like n=1 Tax=Haliotis rubra TaxID=36100 RepID=UPI001EE58184|nr:acyl-coenzyme A synthetase ACSM3, mitochondrial-like [Haliotis rubra]XP_046581929.1 acyl-coenzyme A synthetase ACSM3, mitochondrial-like [Haliotis rubra]XP_046581930.1 acyl-coenzyme A synthetase ACSM3, mitochondrial-like [Haliotis rubra]XP_046581931.1 acyl-coenzyme A synthetase ACSM3, mitochondrial-like [Haliotis rubra]